MYNWCINYIGIPFISGGRNKDGCDCYGLVRLILLEQYKIELPELKGNYSNALCIAETKKLFTENVPVICAEKISSPEEKAIALIKIKGSLCHVGLYAGDGYIIHSRHKLGVVCERITSPLLVNCVEGWYRVDSSYSMSKSIFTGTKRI